MASLNVGHCCGVRCRSAKALKDWALGLVPSHVVNVRNEADLQKLLSSCGGAKGGAKSKDRASWDVCVLLVSDKTKTPVSYKVLSR